MKTLMVRALDLARLRGARYADIRVVHTRTEFISVKNGLVDRLNFDESVGFGVRVLINGAWGFASSNDLTSQEIDRITAIALQIAKASGLVNDLRIDLGPPVDSHGVYRTPVRTDPFGISLDAKLHLLMQVDKEMARVEQVRVRRSNLTFLKEQKWFASTDGAFTDQTIIETGGGFSATAIGAGEIQIRSYPTSAGRQQVAAGWEAVERWNLPENAYRISCEAAALLTADPCPSGLQTTVILSGDQVALQVHESCGHPIELDRVYGTEAAFAGTSFLTPEKLNSLQYGSPQVNLTADSLRPLGLGTYGWDDEGVPAQSTPIVRDGLFMGYLMSRETAARLGTTSNGCMRASGWNRTPLIRMTNVSLEAGSWTFNDLVSDTEEGIYMQTNRSWSIDDRRYNFQFGTEIGYEIKNGKLGRMLRNPTYTGITPVFWNSCDAICNEQEWTMWGTPNCGKGQPIQIAHTGHGAAPARFRNIQVGIFR